jgi:hypothetical protein
MNKDKQVIDPLVREQVRANDKVYARISDDEALKFRSYTILAHEEKE